MTLFAAAPARLVFVLRHADRAMVLSQRLAEWVAHAPELEEDLALANLALDLLGQARALYSYAAGLEGQGRTEDDFAYLRTEREYRNPLLVEQPNGDFAMTMARQFFHDAWAASFWTAMTASTDETLAGIAAKASKETTYHLRHSAAWVVRLGDGTPESLGRMQRAINARWRFVGELFEADEVDEAMAAAGVLPLAATGAHLRPHWDARVRATFEQATLTPPDESFMATGGRCGIHSEHLGLLLAEMQALARTHPGARW